jgi:pSer/pThr/pTyr-binding forkhead associated (FHA) protein
MGASDRRLPQTGRLGRRESPREFNPTPQVSFVHRASDAPGHLLLQVAQPDGSVVTIGASIKERLVIGRGDPSQGVMPDIDLTPYHGQDVGVSRQHVFIFQQGDRLFVQDNHSRNKTWLNNEPLNSENIYPLQDGDVLELGRLKITLYFVYQTRR